MRHGRAKASHHAQAEDAIENFKKTLPARLEEVARNTGVLAEARVRQKNKITCRSAQRSIRPVALADQRTVSTFIFGALCPKEGKAAGLVLSHCNTAAMSLHLAEIAAAVAPGAHAVLLLDQAGWHLSDRLELPPNTTLIPLLPKYPELNPVENSWQFMRDNWLSNRVFHCFDDIVGHCSRAWNRLIE